MNLGLRVQARLAFYSFILIITCNIEIYQEKNDAGNSNNFIVIYSQGFKMTSHYLYDQCLFLFGCLKPI